MRKIMMALPIVGLLLTGSAPSIPIFGVVGMGINPITIPCKIANVSTTCMIDTGNEGSVVAGGKIASKLHIHFTQTHLISTVLGTSEVEQGMASVTALGKTIKTLVTVYPEWSGMTGNIGPRVLYLLGADMRIDFAHDSYSINTPKLISATRPIVTVKKVGPYTDLLSWPKIKGVSHYWVGTTILAPGETKTVLINGAKGSQSIIDTNSVIVAATKATGKVVVELEIEPNAGYYSRAMVELHLGPTNQ